MIHSIICIKVDTRVEGLTWKLNGDFYYRILCLCVIYRVLPFKLLSIKTCFHLFFWSHVFISFSGAISSVSFKLWQVSIKHPWLHCFKVYSKGGGQFKKVWNRISCFRNVSLKNQIASTCHIKTLPKLLDIW